MCNYFLWSLWFWADLKTERDSSRVDSPVCHARKDFPSMRHHVKRVKPVRIRLHPQLLVAAAQKHLWVYHACAAAKSRARHVGKFKPFPVAQIKHFNGIQRVVTERQSSRHNKLLTHGDNCAAAALGSHGGERFPLLCFQVETFECIGWTTKRVTTRLKIERLYRH